MAKIKVYNQTGQEVKEENFSDAIFGVAIKPAVVQQAVVAQQANTRKVIAHTKDRSEVRGGGRKPWRQKGTGRARHGSIRSPLWRGGGVTFGPTKDRNFSVKINKKVRKQALAMSLTDKVLENKLIVLDQISLEQAKTKKIASVFQNLKLRPSKKSKIVKSEEKTIKKESSKADKKIKNILLILDKNDKNSRLAARNLPRVESINVDNINLLSVLKAEYLVASEAALRDIEKNYKQK